LAKVYHDEYVEELCRNEPELQDKYDWENNMGYGTRSHMNGIREHGISKYHRKSFKPCR